MKVAKFGGTSLASAEQIKKVGHIIQADPLRKIVVVSAPGKRFKDDIKVTDLLIACAEKVLSEGKAEAEFDAVVTRFAEIIMDFQLGQQVLGEITKDLQDRMKADTSNKDKYLDAMKAAGEDNNAKIVAYYLQSIGLNAKYMNPKDAGMMVTSEYGNAQLLPDSLEKLRKLRDEEGIVIFPGFFGYSQEGHVVTFSRGGSDITGSILAAATGAELYENFTDVNSVFVASPQLIKQPKELKELTYREMRELAYAGFSVFHEEALIPAFKAGIPVCVKNTNNPSAPGTMIVAERSASETPIAGIAMQDQFSCIYLSKFLMNREIGFGRKLLQILEEEGLSYEHTPSGIDHISVVLRRDQLSKQTEQRVIRRITEELQVDDLQIEHDLALIMIVGEGMRHSIGLASRATRAFATSGVNIELINQGSSEVSMMFGVRALDASRAVQALYQEFFGS